MKLIDIHKPRKGAAPELFLTFVNEKDQIKGQKLRTSGYKWIRRKNKRWMKHNVLLLNNELDISIIGEHQIYWIKSKKEGTTFIARQDDKLYGCKYHETILDREEPFIQMFRQMEKGKMTGFEILSFFSL